LSRHCSKTSKVSARFAQITFGHTHISTTQQIYTYFNEAASRDAAAMAHVTESNCRPSPYHEENREARDISSSYLGALICMFRGRRTRIQRAASQAGIAGG
jgi:hypothetical protein